MCIVDRCTTNTILRKMKYFQTLTKRTRHILTIAGRNTCIVGSEKATRTLLNYKDICKNELHIVTHEENNKRISPHY
jgi:hypothetical protein